MAFIDGFLGLCTACATCSAVEVTGQAGYARQAISFAEPVYGVSFNANGFTFGQGAAWGQVGRGIYDAPTGGNLLLVMPYPVPIAPGRLMEAGEPGFIRLFFPAMAAYPRGAAFTGTLPFNAVGTCCDAWDVAAAPDVNYPASSPAANLRTATITAGSQLMAGSTTQYSNVNASIVRGVFQPPGPTYSR